MSVLRSFGFTLIALSLTPCAARAQPAAQGQPSAAMQGFQMNRDQPVKIESNTLEVRDKSRQATFMGSVKLTQGETVLQCQTLVIFYEDSAAPGAPKKGAPATAQKSGGGLGGQQIKRAEAKGEVLVTQKNQTARGDSGVFDVKSNSVTLIGSVVLTQGTNVVRGDRMVVDLNTGISRVESDKAKRVESLFNPSAAQQPPPAPAPAAPQKNVKPAPAAPPAAKAAPGAPTRIN
jgi:lipopolysaccharide export system protein LptA